MLPPRGLTLHVVSLNLIELRLMLIFNNCELLGLPVPCVWEPGAPAKKYTVIKPGN